MGTKENFGIWKTATQDNCHPDYCHLGQSSYIKNIYKLKACIVTCTQ